MGFDSNLEDCSEQGLLDELSRRSRLHILGICDYCNRATGSEPTCVWPYRHYHGMKIPANKRLKRIRR